MTLKSFLLDVAQKDASCIRVNDELRRLSEDSINALNFHISYIKCICCIFYSCSVFSTKLFWLLLSFHYSLTGKQRNFLTRNSYKISTRFIKIKLVVALENIFAMKQGLWMLAFITSIEKTLERGVLVQPVRTGGMIRASKTYCRVVIQEFYESINRSNIFCFFMISSVERQTSIIWTDSIH